MTTEYPFDTEYPLSPSSDDMDKAALDYVEDHKLLKSTTAPEFNWSDEHVKFLLEQVAKYREQRLLFSRLPKDYQAVLGRIAHDFVTAFPDAQPTHLELNRKFNERRNVYSAFLGFHDMYNVVYEEDTGELEASGVHWEHIAALAGDDCAAELRARGFPSEQRRLHAAAFAHEFPMQMAAIDVRDTAGFARIEKIYAGRNTLSRGVNRKTKGKKITAAERRAREAGFQTALAKATSDARARLKPFARPEDIDKFVNHIQDDVVTVERYNATPDDTAKRGIFWDVVSPLF